LNKEGLKQEERLKELDGSLGPASPEVIEAAIDLANTRGELREYQKELALRTRILEASQQLHVEGRHLLIQAARSGLANVNHRLGNYQKSLDLNEKVLQSAGDSELERRLCLGVKLNMAADLYSLKRFDEAHRVFQEVSAIAMNDLSDDDWIRKSVVKKRRIFERAARAKRG